VLIITRKVGSRELTSDIPIMVGTWPAAMLIAAPVMRLALISGAFLLLVGLIRVGWIVEFIPLVSITSFMTGAAISTPQSIQPE
jgi:MFS superfamily sulfate permease-like transporter